MSEYLERRRNARILLAIGMDQPLSVGETLNLRGRGEEILDAKCWSDLRASSIKFIRTNDQHTHGVQSILIHRVNPFLNSHLLRPRFNIQA
jgi:hypothetical protein